MLKILMLTSANVFLLVFNINEAEVFPDGYSKKLFGNDCLHAKKKFHFKSCVLYLLRLLIFKRMQDVISLY